MRLLRNTKFIGISAIAVVLLGTLIFVYWRAGQLNDPNKCCWSPDKRYYIDGKNDWLLTDSQQQRTALIFLGLKWNMVFGWTSDSRYIVVFSTDQYGNSGSHAFDTVLWKSVFWGPPSTGMSREICGIGTACRHSPVAIAPTTPRVLLEDGLLVRLSDESYTNILMATNKDFISGGAWSPDEKYLVFVAYHDSTKKDVFYDRDYAFYLASGDGSQARKIIDLPYAPKLLQWSPDGQSVAVDSNYKFDVVREQMQTLPATLVK